MPTWIDEVIRIKGSKCLALMSAVCLMLASGCSSGEKSPASSGADTATTTSATSTQETVPETTGTADAAETNTTASAPSGQTATTKRPPAPLTATSTVAKKPIATTKEPTTTTSTAPKPGPRPTFAGPQGTQSFTNLTYNNAGGKMGDADGPAYCVYSQIGYNQASIDILLSELRHNLYRESDQLPLTAYLFLGVDVYDENGRFVNCFDAGLGFHTGKQKWVLFHNILKASPLQEKWYMSAKYLDDTHDYRLVLDTSQEDEWASLILYDLTAGGVEYDRDTFRTMYTRRDGSNTAFYQDYAIDFPEEVKYGTDKQPSTSWPEITLYNTDEGIYMKNLRVVGATLGGAALDRQADGESGGLARLYTKKNLLSGGAGQQSEF